MKKKVLIVIWICISLALFKLNAQEKTELIPKKINEKWGFVDQEGREVIQAKYDEAGEFSEGLAAVVLNKKVGFIDPAGVEIIPFKYDNELVIKGNGMEMRRMIQLKNMKFSKGMVRVLLKGKWGYIDKADKEVIRIKYTIIDDFSENEEVYALSGTKWVKVDRNGKEKSISYRKGMPVKFSFGVVSRTLVDFYPNKTEEGKISITVISAGIVNNTISWGGPIMEINCYFISGGKKYQAYKSVPAGDISETFLFDTSVDPETVVFYEKYHPNEEVKINCK